MQISHFFFVLQRFLRGLNPDALTHFEVSLPLRLLAFLGILIHQIIKKIIISTYINP